MFFYINYSEGTRSFFYSFIILGGFMSDPILLGESENVTLNELNTVEEVETSVSANDETILGDETHIENNEDLPNEIIEGDEIEVSADEASIEFVDENEEIPTDELFDFEEDNDELSEVEETILEDPLFEDDELELSEEYIEEELTEEGFSEDPESDNIREDDLP